VDRVLLALLLAASAQKEKPPAHLAVPKAMQQQREAELDISPGNLPFFANPELAAALGEIDARPGAWVEYLIRSRGDQDVRLRATVLGPALPGKRYWLEFATLTKEGGTFAAKLLVRGNAFRPRDLDALYLLVAGQTPMEIPLDQIDLPPDQQQPPKVKVQRLGKSRVQVKAGAYDAELLRAGDTKIWRAPQVPLWGLVKTQGPRQSVELLSSGMEGGHTVFPKGWGDDDQGKGSESTK
jgi:hypothetical protein